MPPETYIFKTRDGQTLSQILYQEYGYIDSDLLYEVLDLNPGLSELPYVLREGTEIKLSLKEPPFVESISVATLWD